MARIDSRYRKNFGLLIVFLLFVTLLFVISVFFARTITTNFVQTDFNNRKAEVFDETISDFNEFFQENYGAPVFACAACAFDAACKCVVLCKRR